MAVRPRDGSIVRLGRGPVALRRIASLEVIGERGAGYRITPLGTSRSTSAVRLVATRPQPGAPLVGPTVTAALAGRTPSLTVRIAVRA